MTARGRAALFVALVALPGGCRRTQQHEASPPSPPAARAAAPSATASAATPTPAPQTAHPTGALRELTWHYDTTAFGPSDVVVAIPTDGAPDAKWPVLIAFHGRGESLRGAKRGARGWLDDYTLPKTTKRLTAPPLNAGDLLGMVTDEHLAAMNDELRKAPYQGLIVVCPFLPDVLRGSRGESDGKLLAAFVVDEVLPRVYRETPAIGTPATTGIDGVSLGGRASLFVGFERAEAFGAIGALQPALDNDEAVRVAELAQEARAKNPTFSLRLLTSDEDYFLEPTQLLSRALKERNIAHRLDVVSGTHSYEFNRGPGGYEMLLFHDSALRAPLPTPR